MFKSSALLPYVFPLFRKKISSFVLWIRSNINLSSCRTLYHSATVLLKMVPMLKHCPFDGGGFDVVDSLLIVAPIVCAGFMCGPCFVVKYLENFLVLQSSR